MKEGVERNQEERVVQLIRLKRYEQPADEYFETLPYRIMRRIQALEEREAGRSRWSFLWEGWRIQWTPMVATACLAAGIGFLIGFWLRPMIGSPEISPARFKSTKESKIAPIEQFLSSSSSTQRELRSGPVFLQPLPSFWTQTGGGGLQMAREGAATDSPPPRLPNFNWTGLSKWWGPTGWEFSDFPLFEWNGSNEELKPFWVIPFEEREPEGIQPAAYPDRP